MLENFLANIKTRLPQSVLAQDPATSSGSWRTSLPKAIAKDVERISFNSPIFINCITVDFDGAAALDEKWQDFDLPPTLSVSNRPDSRSGRPGRHDTYFLAAPVFVGAGARTKPVAFARFLRRALTAEFGGDRRYTNLLTKNPWHSKHFAKTPYLWSGDQGFLYEFDHFKEKIDLEKWSAIFRRDDAENRGRAVVELDESARNSSLFDAARSYAYGTAKSGDYSFAGLSDYIEQQNLLFIEPLGLGETRLIARSIDRFIATRYSGGSGLSDLQRQRQRKGADVRRARSKGPAILARLEAGVGWAQIGEEFEMTANAVKVAARRARHRARAD